MTTTEQLYQLYKQHPVISTDTRRIAAGSLFFALKGDKFDANTFAKQAVEAGAAYAIIDNPECQAGERFILVADVLTALQDLARYHRRQLTIPVIGLTGTNGKTTTKELINSVLSTRFKTQATQGNLNNHIGVPLTILTIDESHEMAVIEMGANHQKEIALLCSIAQPDYGMITNVGKAHLEGFGGVEGVKKGKGEMYDWLSREVWKSGSPETGTQTNLSDFRPSGLSNAENVAFINCSDKVLKDMAQARGLSNIVWYGADAPDKCLVSGSILENAPLLTVQWVNNKTGASSTVKTQLTGAYNLDNILAAICIGTYFKLSADEINNGIESYQPKNNRSQIVKTETNTLICDYYNANPSSMMVAIENISKLQASSKVLILGDMFEMGDTSIEEHTAVIKKALDTPVDERIFIGKDFYEAGSSIENSQWSTDKKPIFFLTAEDVIESIKAKPIQNSTILIKGSRGMALERLLELF